MTGHIHSLESFGTVDGPGIRYVVFFQGCPMRCKYCHNPDTWNTSAGTEMTSEEILDHMLRNIEFYEDGGLTVTGGEALLQIDFLIDLFSKAKKHNIHTCLDTSGILFNPENPLLMRKFHALAEVTDLVLLDIKHINSMEHKLLTGHPNEAILQFLSYLDRHDIPVWIRHVVVPEITYNEEELTALGKLLQAYQCIQKIEVLPYHTMGEIKYEQLGIPYPLKDTPALTEAEAKKAEEIILDAFKK